MASAYDKASLVMLPHAYKDDKLYSVKPEDRSGDFTFSRDGAGASPATRVNASGLIEKGYTNELLQSNTFSTNWTRQATSLTSGQTGYDGSSDAWLFNADSTGVFRFLLQSTNTNAVITNSMYAKAGTTDFIAVVDARGSSSCIVWFDLGNGAVGSVLNNNGDYIDSSIESVGGGWYRCSATFKAATSGSALWFVANGDGSNNADAGDNVYIQDAMQNEGLVAQDYIETTTAPVSAGLLGDMPRLDYSGGATCPSLLLEPSRVNSITQSEYVNSWGVKTNISVVSNSGTSPEGVVNASNIYPTATGACFFYEGSITYTSGTTYTYSVFAKANGKDYLQITTSGASFSNQYCTFDLALGATDNNGFESVGIEDYGNGWYRCYVVETSISTASSRFVIGLVSNANAGRLSSVTANGTDGVLIYGVVSEAGSYPTSYIPTYGSASTRGADLGAVSYTGLTTTSGTLFFDLKEGFNSNSINSGVASLGLRLSSTGTNNSIGLRDATSSGLQGVIRVNSTSTYLGGVFYGTSNTKICFSWNATSVKMFKDGVLVDSEAISTPAVFDLFDLPNSSRVIQAGLNQTLIFPTALTDAECIALTTI